MQTVFETGEYHVRRIALDKVAVKLSPKEDPYQTWDPIFVLHQGHLEVHDFNSEQKLPYFLNATVDTYDLRSGGVDGHLHGLELVGDVKLTMFKKSQATPGW